MGVRKRHLSIREVKLLLIGMRDGVQSEVRNVQPHIPLYMISQIGLNCGYRIGDILSLTKENITHIKDPKTNELFVQIELTESKRGKHNTKLVRGQFAKDLMTFVSHFREGEKLFDYAKPSICRALSRFGEALYLDGLGTHSFRKTYAMRLYKASENDIVLVSLALRHSSVETTMKYLNLIPERVKETSFKVQKEFEQDISLEEIIKEE